MTVTNIPEAARAELAMRLIRAYYLARTEEQAARLQRMLSRIIGD